MDLISPTEDEANDNNNDILFVKEKSTPKEDETEKKDEKLYEKKHENNGEDANKDGKQAGV